jgi:metal-responsive CopG/Arc/MetJ family transcriptional regulator
MMIHMRTIIDISAEDIAELKRIQQKQSVSRAELIRRAIAELVRCQRQISVSERPGFGAWKRHKEDGATYQKRMRSEWSG